VPDLIRLAERRLVHGPFDFELTSEIAGQRDAHPLLARVAEAIGRCALGRWEGATYASEAHATLTKLAASEDERIRAAALEALTWIEIDAFPGAA
jgi:hypothetical protein